MTTQMWWCVSSLEINSFSSMASLVLNLLKANWLLLPVLLVTALALSSVSALLPPAALVLLVTFGLQAAISLASALQAVVPTREGELEQLMLTAKAAMKDLVLPRDFVEKSKLERSYNACEKELLQLQGKQDVYKGGKKQAAKAPPPDIASLLTYSVQPMALLVLACLFWRTPMLQLAPGLLWPLGWLYAGKHGIGISCWLWLCSTTASRAVPALADALGVAPQKQKSFLESIGLSWAQPFVNMLKLS